MVENGFFFYVQPAEGERTEVDGPDGWGDLLEPDVLAAKEVADVDPSGVSADAAVRADFADLEVGRILGRPDPRGERPQ